MVDAVEGVVHPVRVLEDRLDVAPEGPPRRARHPPEVLGLVEDLAARRGDQAEQEPGQGRLPAAAFPHDRGDRGAVRVERHREVREGGGVTRVGEAPAARLAVALGDAARLEERRHGVGDARWHATQEPARASWNAHPGGRSRSGGGRPGMPWNDPFRARDGRVAISIPV